MEMTTNYKTQYLKYVSTNVLSMIGMSIYILADTFFIAQGVGTNGLTALNLALPIYNFIEGTGQMIGIGGASMFIVHHYQQKRKSSNEVFTTAFTTGLVIGLLFMLIGFFGADDITRLLGADEEVFDMTCIYLRMILIFAPAFILNNILSVFVKNDGEPTLAMAGMLAGSIFNSVFDYIFIFPLKLGIFGAVLATVSAPIAGMLVLSLHFFRKKHNFSFHIPLYRLSNVLPIMSRGVSTLITEVATGIVTIACNIMILNLNGNVGVAAYGVILNVYLVVIAIFNGVAQGSQPLFGTLYAKDDKKGLKITFRYSFLTVGVLSFIIYVATMGFPNQLVEIFNSEKNTALTALAVDGFRLYFIGTFFFGCNIVMLLYFISIGREHFSLAMSLCRGLILVLPLAFVLSSILGITGIWIATPITEILVFTMGMIYYFYLSRNNKAENFK